MIEANNPEINVDELMERIREEVARQQKVYVPATDIKSIDVMSKSAANINYIEALLNNAEAKSQVRTELPKKLDTFPFNFSKTLQRVALKIYGFLFKEQRAVNFSIIQALRESVALNRQLIEQVKILQSQVEGLGDRISTTDEQLKGLGDRISTTDEQLKGLGDRLSATDEQVNAVSDRISTTDEQLKGLGDRLSATDEQVNAVSDRLSATDERYLRNDSYIKNDLAQQKRLITLFLEEARQRLPEPFTQEQLQTFTNEDQHWLDAFYVAFEDQFRGTREDIFNRFKVYVPLIAKAKVGTSEAAILDIGCGRGEWLDLLRESGYTARGLDINRVMLEQCRARGLDVLESDVIAYLQSLPDASLGAVTGFHIIEHLPFQVLIKVFDETLRVLKPGGLAIFETPNPQNVLVGSHSFYLDPTHRNPLPSSMIKLVAETRGLCRVKILELHPYPNEFRIGGSQLAEQFSDYFYGPQDYAVVGYKL